MALPTVRPVLKFFSSLSHGPRQSGSSESILPSPSSSRQLPQRYVWPRQSVFWHGGAPPWPGADPARPPPESSPTPPSSSEPPLPPPVLPPLVPALGDAS